MSINWQPIETAPMEMPCLVTDGEYFAVGQTWLYTEPDTIGYNSGRVGWQNDERPNPKAGQTEWFWRLNGCTAFSMEADIGCNWDHEITDFNPTHWVPVIEPPATELQHEGESSGVVFDINL